MLKEYRQGRRVPMALLGTTLHYHIWFMVGICRVVLERVAQLLLGVLNISGASVALCS